MRRAVLLATGLVTFAVVAVACSGGSKGGLTGHGELTSGNYELYNFAKAGGDACGFFPAVSGVLNSASVAVTVNGQTFTVDLGGISPTGAYSAGVFHGTVDVPYDWSTSSLALDCQETDTYAVDGATTAPDVGAATFTVKFVKAGGTQCDQVYQQLSQSAGQTITLPCTSHYSFNLTKVGPPTPPPVPVTALLVSGTGYGTNLSNDYFSHNTASTLVGHATANSMTFDYADNFQCYSPTATGTTHYELGSYLPGQFTLTVGSANWMAGSVTLGTANTLSIDWTDVAGNELVAAATSGTITLSSAPLTTALQCSFGASNVSMPGTLYPVAAFASHPVKRPPMAFTQITARDKKLPKAIEKRAKLVAPTELP